MSVAGLFVCCCLSHNVLSSRKLPGLCSRLGTSSLRDETSKNASSSPGTRGSEDYILEFRCHKEPKFPIGFVSGKPVV